MIPIDADELPSLDDAFINSGYTTLLKTLKDAGFKTVASLMALPREALLEIPHVGTTAVSRIAKVLQKHNLEQRDLNENLFSFIDRQFGRAEDAPIGVLQVVINRQGVVNWPVYAPLELIGVLEEFDDQHLTLDYLMRVTSFELRLMVETRVPLEGRVHDLQQDIHHLSLRLRYLGFDFAVLRTSQLYAV